MSNPFVLTDGLLRQLKQLGMLDPAKFDGQYLSPLYAIGNSGASKTVDWHDGNVQSVTLTGACAFAFSNGIAGGRYCLVINTGAGSFTPTFPAAVKWLGSTPTPVTTASKKYVVTMVFDGTDYLASYAEEA